MHERLEHAAGEEAPPWEIETDRGAELPHRKVTDVALVERMARTDHAHGTLPVRSR